jgi:hypothetical protein
LGIGLAADDLFETWIPAGAGMTRVAGMKARSAGIRGRFRFLDSAALHPGYAGIFMS